MQDERFLCGTRRNLLRRSTLVAGSMSSRPSPPHAQTDPSISDTERNWVVTAYALAVGGYSCSEK